MSEAFTALHLHPASQYNVGPFLIDFAFVEKKVAVECDGIYWHSLPERIKKDLNKDNYLKGRGWYVIRLGEIEIKQSAQDCATRVLSVLDERTVSAGTSPKEA